MKNAQYPKYYFTYFRESTISDMDILEAEILVIDPDLHPGTLVTTCHNIIVSLWHKDGTATTQQYDGLNVHWTSSYDLQDHSSSSIFTTPSVPYRLVCSNMEREGDNRVPRCLAVVAATSHRCVMHLSPFPGIFPSCHELCKPTFPIRLQSHPLRSANSQSGRT
jgi:hypothetical protein